MESAKRFSWIVSCTDNCLFALPHMYCIPYFLAQEYCNASGFGIFSINISTYKDITAHHCIKPYCNMLNPKKAKCSYLHFLIYFHADTHTYTRTTQKHTWKKTIYCSPRLRGCLYEKNWTTLCGRWNDVKTLKRRRNNVVLTSCAGRLWDKILVSQARFFSYKHTFNFWWNSWKRRVFFI